MIHVTDRPNVHMRLRPLKLLLCQLSYDPPEKDVREQPAPADAFQNKMAAGRPNPARGAGKMKKPTTGFGPVTSSLPKRCATPAPRGHSFRSPAPARGRCRRAPRTPTETARTACLLTKWGEEDSNLCRRSPADLQSAPFGRSGIPPQQSSASLAGAAARAPPRRTGLRRARRIVTDSRRFLQPPRTGEGADDVRDKNESRRRESNPQPAVYKTAALPLSYVGDGPRKSSRPTVPATTH